MQEECGCRARHYSSRILIHKLSQEFGTLTSGRCNKLREDTGGGGDTNDRET